MNGSSLLGLASTLAFLVPPALVISFRLYRHLPFVALAVYCLLGALHNAMKLDILTVSPDTLVTLGTLNNYLDGPLMLLMLHFFCSAPVMLKVVRTSLILLLGYEVLVALTYGLSRTACTLVLGPTIALVLLVGILLFVRHIRLTVELNKGLGKTLLLAGIVFGYGCFGIIYFLYYLKQFDAYADILLLFYAATIIYAGLITTGLLFLRHHFRELEELRTARRELRLFFNH